MSVKEEVQKFTKLIDRRLNPKGQLHYGILLIAVNNKGMAEFGTNMPRDVLISLLEDQLGAMKHAASMQ
jgi:hypothetical protein